MATNNKSQCSDSGLNASLVCDACESNNITQNESGYVCKECGLMLDIQKMEYYRPYNQDILQYAPLGKTQIGFKMERMRNPYSYHLERLNKIDSMKSNEENIILQASVEINRIFEALSLPDSDKNKILRNFKHIRSQVLRGTKYRTPERLVPLTIYFTYKFNCKPINEEMLLGVSQISKDDFQAFKLQIQSFMPKYKNRDRQEYVIQRIMELSEHFGLGMYFYYQSRKILERLWEIIKNTKDDVVVGVVTSISALCLPENPVTVSKICKKLNIRMSTIHKQVEKKIFERLRVPGFKSLVRSANLLKEVMVKLGVLLDQFMDNDIIEITLGTAQQVFNAHDTIDYYFYALKDTENNPHIFSLGINREVIDHIFDKDTPILGRGEEPGVDPDLMFNMEVWKVKGPPLVIS
ncbi:MAG: DC1 domain-containing protein [Candidatus Odinarchaeota archaeon]